MNKNIEKLQANSADLRKQIIEHSAYEKVKTIDDLKKFMELHVYAVWDFMSLLKSLQRELTCTTIPWFPVGNASVRHLINEIVVDEESDVNRHGERKSHFEMYLEAMEHVGANTQEITDFISHLQSGCSLDESFGKVNTHPASRAMVKQTFSVIDQGKPHVQAAVFTFGREDLIPAMFLAIIEDMHAVHPEQMADFKYYLERHIEVDGGSHSHLALQMTTDLCGKDEKNWEEATIAVRESLERRIELWNGVQDLIERAIV